jgi:hypothetical protein
LVENDTFTTNASAMPYTSPAVRVQRLLTGNAVIARLHRLQRELDALKAVDPARLSDAELAAFRGRVRDIHAQLDTIDAIQQPAGDPPVAA